MNKTKKIICALVAVVLIASLCTVAIASKDSKPFSYYTALGDSIGYHMQKGRVYTTNSSGFLRHTYPCMIYDHYDIGDGFYGNRCGWRATEALVALREDYYGDDYTENFLPDWGHMTIEDIKALSAEYIEGIKKADLITINFGSNDLLGTSTYADRKADANPDGAALEKATDLTKAVTNFPKVWKEFIAEIKELNPDAMIFAISIYNPASGGTTAKDKLQQTLINTLNKDMKNYADKGGYTFIDIGTPDLIGTRDSSHLGDIGHTEVANKIIKAIDAELAKK